MKNNKIKIVEYIRRVFISYILSPCGPNLFKSSLVVMVVHSLCSIFGFFRSLLHVDDDSVRGKGEKFVSRKKKCEDLEVLHKEGLIDIYSIASYIRSHYKKDCLMFVSKKNKHSRHHVDHLFDFLKKTYYSRTISCPIVIKGPCCTFKLVVDPFYRSTTKYLQVSNIVKKSVSAEKSLKPLESCGKSKHLLQDQFFFSKNLNIIDKITIHEKKDVRNSLHTMNTFLMYYKDKMQSKNVSWYCNANSDEYKVMVLTDIVSSTKLWCDSYEDMSMAITKHDYIALNLIEKYNGVVSRNEGDSFLIFFDSVKNAVGFSLKFNKQIQQIKVLGENLKIKIAVHAGVVKLSAGKSLDAHGKPVHEISAMLSHAGSNRICINRNLLNGTSLSSHDVFCVH
ncbi:hypothetical protein NGRA_0491 [Nosema granulosis]|uniref:Guanylate cyclase domain-containing protein n=1 Tax=Nosema granulosis TaxID=83296 RepID=A0A9P6L0H7_9MICR|nr:hypothetical protein NGRA_0491 [Nosema granulosis]